MSGVDDLIAWSNIQVDSSASNYNDSIIGKGKFGPVFRAKLVTSSSDELSQSEDVAVKLVTKSLLQNPNSYDSSVKIALAEVNVIQEANRKILSDFDCIVKLYGGVRGVLPAHLASTFQLNTTDDCVGIVLRFESGGSLDTLLYPQDKETKCEIDLTEKLRLLTNISSGLAELHGHGIVHGDIKPANILLSGHTPPQVRLSDFGLSTVRSDADQLTGSTLNQTYHVKGTPVYNAPEKLFNPFSDEEVPTISDSTRKTDMYALAILTWEVLSGVKPFESVKQETQLSVKVHKGERPPVSKLPSDLGDEVTTMITKCWSVERSERLTAIECACTLDRKYQSMSTASYEAYFSYSSINKPFVRQVYNFFLQRKVRVWCDEDDSKRVLEHTKIAGISSCKSVISFISKSYQDDSHTKLDIQIAADMKKPILSLLIEPVETIGAIAVDLRTVAAIPGAWVEGSEPSQEAHAAFRSAIKASGLIESLTETIHQASLKPDLPNPSEQEVSLDVTTNTISNTSDTTHVETSAAVPEVIASPSVHTSPISKVTKPPKPARPSSTKLLESKPNDRASTKSLEPIADPSSVTVVSASDSSVKNAVVGTVLGSVSPDSVSAENESFTAMVTPATTTATTVESPLSTKTLSNSHLSPMSEKVDFAVSQNVSSIMQLAEPKVDNAVVDTMLHRHASAISTAFENMGLSDVATVSYPNVSITERKPAFDGLEKQLVECARENKFQELVDLLFTYHVTDVIDIPEPSGGQTALMAASENGHTRVVELLLNRGAKANVTNKSGESAVIIASKKNHCDTVNLLLNRGADANLVDCDGSTVLEWECFHGNIGTVIQLLERRVSILNVNKKGDSALSCASRNGHEDVVQLLVSRGAAVKTNMNNLGRNETSVIWASRNGHLQTVDLLLQGGVDVNCTDSEGNTALMFASLNGHYAIISRLLGKGAQINAVNKFGISALTQASKMGHTDCVRLLLNQGAHANTYFRIETALIWACQNGHLNVVKLLVEAGAQINTTIDSDGRAPLISACFKGHTEVVHYLIARDANVNILSANKATSLIWASRNGHTDVVKLLLNCGATFNNATTNGNTALILASWNGHDDIVRVLLAHRTFNSSSGNTSPNSLARVNSWSKPDPIDMVNLEAANENKETALILASRHGHTSIVQHLLDAGADTAANDADGQTSLILATEFNHLDTVRLLLNRGANVNSKTRTGETSLLWATRNHLFDIVTLLLDRGADASIANINGDTPLFIASSQGYIDIMKVLLIVPLNINCMNSAGETALIGAARNEHLEVVVALLEKKVNVNIANNKNKTAVMIASKRGHAEIVKTLLEAGADGGTALRAACKDGVIDAAKVLLQNQCVVDIVNKSNNEGASALHLASDNGHVEAVKLLLDYEAKVDLVNEQNGNTALIRASKNGHYQVVEMLLNRGANIDAINKKGKSAIVYAASKDHYKIVKLLKSKGAKSNDSRCQQS